MEFFFTFPDSKKITNNRFNYTKENAGHIPELG